MGLDVMDGVGWDGMGWDGTGWNWTGGGLVCSPGPDVVFIHVCFLMEYADRADVVRFMPGLSQSGAAAHKCDGTMYSAWAGAGIRAVNEVAGESAELWGKHGQGFAQSRAVVYLQGCPDN